MVKSQRRVGKKKEPVVGAQRPERQRRRVLRQAEGARPGERPGEGGVPAGGASVGADFPNENAYTFILDRFRSGRGPNE